MHVMKLVARQKKGQKEKNVTRNHTCRKWRFHTCRKWRFHTRVPTSWARRRGRLRWCRPCCACGRTRSWARPWTRTRRRVPRARGSPAGPSAQTPPRQPHTSRLPFPVSPVVQNNYCYLGKLRKNSYFPKHIMVYIFRDSTLNDWIIRYFMWQECKMLNLKI